MLDYVYGQDELVAQFVAQLIPHVRGYGFARAKAIGVIDADGRLVGGIVYHDYNPQSGVIMLAAAATSPRWLTRETLRRMYEYPFAQLGVQMVAQPTPADNERLLRQLAALDYIFVLVPRMFGRERDGVLALFTREAWQKSRFIRRPELRLERPPEMYENTAYDGAGAGRDRITQALMQVQTPPPVADVPPMPPPPMLGGAPGGAPGGALGGGMPPAASGAPGMGQPMMPQLGAAVPPGMQPGGMLAPQPMAGAAPQPMPPRSY